jgi:multiple sugar transport system permease protein
MQGWMFIGPVVFGTLIFNALPMIPTFYTSFTNWNGLNSPQWTGIGNYKRALGGHDPEFVRSVINTLVYTVAFVPLGILVGLGLALLVNSKARGMTVFRALFFLPVVTSMVAVGMMWRWIFDWQYGVINWLLGLVGITGPHWLNGPTTAMIAVVITGIWSSMGYNMVILLAGLQGVPQELVDSAYVDGAGRFARFRHVTLPLITPTIFFLVILSTIGSFQVFGLIYVMTSGGPGDSTYVYIYHLWNQAFQLRNMGYGSALAVLLFLVLAGITWGQWRLSKRWVHYQ